MRYLVCLIFLILIFFVLLFNPYFPSGLFQKRNNDQTSNTFPDLVIGIKTTRINHKKRAKEIVDTWFQLAPEDIFFVTDASDATLNHSTKGHLINSYCPIGHYASALVCKVNRILRLFVETNAKWSCIFDDDNFVNVPLLKETLLAMDEAQPFYLGKKSTAEPVSIYDGSKTTRPFWFGTGGAGVCLSRAAVQKMAPRLANNGFRNLSSRLGLTDDMALGFFMANVLGIELTEMKNFHSHLEELSTIPVKDLKFQPVLSGSVVGGINDNLVALPYLFDPETDPYKFRSLYCYIFRYNCPAFAEPYFFKLENAHHFP
uniref:Fringe n=2 Tax=Panagrolaimus sp. JU765 TaxID=591449 RepID=A0AC34RJH7_9BILA